MRTPVDENTVRRAHRIMARNLILPRIGNPHVELHDAHGNLLPMIAGVPRRVWYYVDPRSHKQKHGRRR